MERTRRRIIFNNVLFYAVIFEAASLTLAAFVPGAGLSGTGNHLGTSKHIVPTGNRISDVSVACDASNFNVTVSMEQPFKGVIFAKEFSQECKTYGSLSYDVRINLPTSGCGVRLTSLGDNSNTSSTKQEEKGLMYTVHLVIQQDRHLRQFTDQERIVQCHVGEKLLALHSDALRRVVQKRITGKTRKGRMHDDEDNDKDYNTLEASLAAARAWMEIVPEEDEAPRDTLKVGEGALLSIKSTLPDGIGWKVVDCVAHDGLGDSSQKLLDEEGCPFDELLMPKPLKGVAKPIALMRHQEAVSRFSAFKFPDRDRLHLSCGLQLCKGQCKQLSCDSKDTSRGARSTKDKDGKNMDSGEILDRLEVFNSVEVIAPGIELEDIYRQEANDVLTAPFKNIPGDRAFCVSPNKMALTFCALGLVFLIAVVVAACALFRARRSGVQMPYYPRSLFSSSASGSAYGGSKLLLQDSPILHPSPHGRTLPYGRIM